MALPLICGYAHSPALLLQHNQGWSVAPLVMFVFPAACYLKVFWDNLEPIAERTPLLVLIAASCIVAVYGTALQIMTTPNSG